VTVDTHNGQLLTTQAQNGDVKSIYFSFSRKRKLRDDLGFVGITSVPVPIRAI
jgi:hypothetical protein